MEIYTFYEYIFFIVGIKKTKKPLNFVTIANRNTFFSVYV